MKFRRQLALALVVLSFALVVSGCRGVGVQSVPAGIRIEMKARPGTLPADPQKREQVMKSLMNVTRMRVVNLPGVVEPVVDQKGSDRVIVELPGVKDPQKATVILTQNASLEFYHLKNVRGANNRFARWEMRPPASAGQSYEFRDSSGQMLDSIADAEQVMSKVVNAYDPVKNPKGEKPVLTGRYLRPNAISDIDPQSGAVIMIEFDRQGTEIFKNFTRSHKGEYLAIFYNGQLVTAPVIQEMIPSGQARISGFSTISEAQQVTEMLNSGPLPVPVDAVRATNVPAHKVVRH